MVKDNIQENLVHTGRALIADKGAEFLTARKLSEASGYSVGTIYNQFGNMDNYILIQNYLTLESLYHRLKEAKKDVNAYEQLQRYADTFYTFVLQNKNFWYLVYTFHLKNNDKHFSVTYLRRISEILLLLDAAFCRLYPTLKAPRRIISLQILWVSFFSLSAFFTTNALNRFTKMDQQKIPELLLSTYLTGLKVLEKMR